MTTKLEKLIREIRSLQAERDLARSIAHARGLDASELEAQNRRLREVLEDTENSHKFVMAEDCPDDEKHCGCVPILRAELEAEKTQLLRLRKALKNIARASYEHYSANEARRALEDKP